MTYDPAFTNTASCKSRITFIDGDKGILNYRGYPDRGAGREEQLPRDRLPHRARGAAHEGPVRHLGLQHHPPHDGPREHQGAHGRVPLRRPPHGHALLDRGRPLYVLSGGEGRPRPAEPAQPDLPAHRQDPDPGRVRLPALPGPALRLSRQRPLLLRQLPADDVQGGGALQGEPRPREGPRGALHPARRPRAELLHLGHAGRGQLGRGPLLGHRRRHRRPLRARSTGAPTRRSCGCSRRSGASTRSPPSSRR